MNRGNERRKKNRSGLLHFSFSLSLPSLPAFFFSRPQRARESSFIFVSSFKQKNHNVRSPARPPRLSGAGGRGGPFARSCSHRPPRPRGGQKGRGPPHRGTIVEPIALGFERENWSFRALAEVHETREEMRRVDDETKYSPTDDADVFFLTLSPPQFFPFHTRIPPQNRLRSAPRRPPRWPSSGSAARRATPTS